jgi:hypothetical protein
MQVTSLISTTDKRSDPGAAAGAVDEDPDPAAPAPAAPACSFIEVARPGSGARLQLGRPCLPEWQRGMSRTVQRQRAAAAAAKALKQVKLEVPEAEEEKLYYRVRSQKYSS